MGGSHAIERMLSGGDPRSLGRAEEAVADVLQHPERFDALFACVFAADETVRMRAADAVEKVLRQRPELALPYRERLLADVAAIAQPSVQWHLAQILARVELTPAQRDRAIGILRRNLADYDDWIVVNLTTEALAHFARDDPALREELVPILRRQRDSERRSIAKRATRLLAQLEAPPESRSSDRRDAPAGEAG